MMPKWWTNFQKQNCQSDEEEEEEEEEDQLS
jgi:hypothetical protein